MKALCIIVWMCTWVLERWSSWLYLSKNLQFYFLSAKELFKSMGIYPTWLVLFKYTKLLVTFLYMYVTSFSSISYNSNVRLISKIELDYNRAFQGGPTRARPGVMLIIAQNFGWCLSLSKRSGNSDTIQWKEYTKHAW